MSSPIANFLTSPRGVITTVFAGFGIAFGLWAGSVPTVLDAAGIGDAAFGLGIAAYTVAYVTAMFLGSTLTRLASNRTVLLLSLPLTAVANISLLASSGPVWFFISIAATGGLLGLIDVVMNAEASHIESDLGRPVFTGFHGAASLSMAVFAILGSLLAAWTGMAGVIAVAAFGLAVVWLAVWRFLPSHRNTDAASTGPANVASFVPLVVLGLSAGLVIACETAAVMWSAPLLYAMAPGLSALSGAGVAFFGLCMAAVRFGGDRLRARFGDIATMLGSLATAIAGFAIIGQSQDFTLSLTGFALTGFGTACLVPAIVALAAAQTPGNRAAGIGLASLIAGVPRTLAPWVFGGFAQTFSLSAAFGLCVAALVVTVGLIMLLARLKPRYA